MGRQSRRHFIPVVAGAATAPSILRAQPRRPNVIILITDDQGYGDLSLHGNPHLQTPHLDSIGRQGVQFTQFHVNPVCSPTRASLLTGRYYYRTGVVDTFLGRSMMHADETTLAELLRSAGYRTGLFGKWHLGDNYPLRPIDQGFEESLNCTGGGLTQPSDPPGNTYFDPLLRHNGNWERRKGYCTDIFIGAAIEWIERHHKNPFFAYIATNAPHTPLQVDESYVLPFRKLGLDETTAKVYGMVRNLDAAVGRLLGALRRLKLEQDTIVIFLTDNGPQQDRYNAGMRGRKGTVYEGGIRVPFFLRWPRRFAPGVITQLAAHIDVLPTLLEACGIPRPKDVLLDGRSLMPLLEGKTAAWLPRTLFFQWHRGDRPNPHQNAAAMDGRFKLVNGVELYELMADPAEKSDISSRWPELVRTLRQAYERWFADVSATRNFEPPRIFLGTDHENPVTLTRQDWRGPRASWNPDGLGHWEVDVRRGGLFRITLRMAPVAGHAQAVFRLGGAMRSATLAPGAEQLRLEPLELAAGPGRLEAWIDHAGRTSGVHYVDVEKI